MALDALAASVFATQSGTPYERVLPAELPTVWTCTKPP